MAVRSKHKHGRTFNFTNQPQQSTVGSEEENEMIVYSLCRKHVNVSTEWSWRQFSHIYVKCELHCIVSVGMIFCIFVLETFARVSDFSRRFSIAFFVLLRKYHMLWPHQCMHNIGVLSASKSNAIEFFTLQTKFFFPFLVDFACYNLVQTPLCHI